MQQTHGGGSLLQAVDAGRRTQAHVRTFVHLGGSYCKAQTQGARRTADPLLRCFTPRALGGLRRRAHDAGRTTQSDRRVTGRMM